MLSEMVAVAVRKKVVSIDHFLPSLCLQTLQYFLFIRSNQEQLYIENQRKIGLSQMS